MRIIFHKVAPGSDRLTCNRADGSLCQETLSSGSAYHDLAHYVVEKELGLQEGIWGRIAAGFTMTEYLLPNAERPFQITPEGYQAEFLATLVQSAVPTGKIDPEYLDLLRQVVTSSGLPFPELPPDETMHRLIVETQALTREWERLSVGEKLELEF